MGDFDELVPVVCLFRCTKAPINLGNHFVYQMDTCRLTWIRLDISRYIFEIGCGCRRIITPANCLKSNG
jgi:hypothetical protein